MNQQHHSRTGTVTAVTKTADGYEIQVSMGTNVPPQTAEHYDAPGSEQPPVVGDYVTLVPADGAGNFRSGGYSIPGEPVAASGEHRFISRDASGSVTGSLHFKADGSLEITASKVTINGVTIDTDGTFTAPKEVFWQGDGTKVAASTHIHKHPMGPTEGPISPPAPPDP